MEFRFHPFKWREGEISSIFIILTYGRHFPSDDGSTEIAHGLLPVLSKWNKGREISSDYYPFLIRMGGIFLDDGIEIAPWNFRFPVPLKWNKGEISLIILLYV
ncbi:hypothetical protein AVEN_24668-1 [Araneus ventricosus]|uniref:Uncharacterized protein n=1 Tax=Araneus ventricosus TaxID=182803 RepID=A0A4Y2TAM1_ARAVE|nr:hypothetical protein AVEN_24668-1 [Araneus ventricosus]